MPDKRLLWWGNWLPIGMGQPQATQARNNTIGASLMKNTKDTR